MAKQAPVPDLEIINALLKNSPFTNRGFALAKGLNPGTFAQFLCGNFNPKHKEYSEVYMKIIAALKKSKYWAEKDKKFLPN